MNAKLLHAEHEKTFVLVFDKGNEVMAGLQDFAKQHKLNAAHFTGIGAFGDVTLGYFDRDRKDYKKISLNEQVEVLSLVGNIALGAGEPKVHAHVVLGRSDGTAHGGHLLAAHVWPTLEVIVTEEPPHLRRTIDAETGLPLIDLEASGGTAAERTK
jgi:uncharacterized protein